MSEAEKADGAERPKIVIDLNECSSASALEEKIAIHADVANEINRLVTDDWWDFARFQ